MVKLLFKDISNFGFGGHFVQRSGMLCAILVEATIRNIAVKLFWIWSDG